MSTPVKPPGGPQGPSGPLADSPDASRVDQRAGEFRELVDAEGSGPAGADASGGAAASALDASSIEGSSAEAPSAAASPSVSGVAADLRAGRIDTEQAIEQLVDRALAGAPGLPEGERRALAAQLREALSEDPTLVTLRRDLERASTQT